MVMLKPSVIRETSAQTVGETINIFKNCQVSKECSYEPFIKPRRFALSYLLFLPITHLRSLCNPIIQSVAGSQKVRVSIQN